MATPSTSATAKKPAATRAKAATSKTVSAKSSKPVVSKPAPAEKKTISAKTSKAPAAKMRAPATPKAEAAKNNPALSPATPLPSAMMDAPSPEQHYRMIQEAAYFLAEKNGFAGKSADYWAAAESQISMMISGSSA